MRHAGVQWGVFLGTHLLIYGEKTGLLHACMPVAILHAGTPRTCSLPSPAFPSLPASGHALCAFFSERITILGRHEKLRWGCLRRHLTSKSGVWCLSFTLSPYVFPHRRLFPGVKKRGLKPSPICGGRRRTHALHT